jgi:hypothetical protein
MWNVRKIYQMSLQQKLYSLFSFSPHLRQHNIATLLTLGKILLNFWNICMIRKFVLLLTYGSFVKYEIYSMKRSVCCQPQTSDSSFSPTPPLPLTLTYFLILTESRFRKEWTERLKCKENDTIFTSGKIRALIHTDMSILSLCGLYFQLSPNSNNNNIIFILKSFIKKKLKLSLI